MNLERIEPTRETNIPISENNKIQMALIEEFRSVHGIADAEKNACAMDWIARFAGLFRQLSNSEDGAHLIEAYTHAGDEKEKELALDEMQKALERLSQPN